MGVGSGLKLRSFFYSRFSQKAWNPHSAMGYGICWFTGSREFQSVLSSVLCEEKRPTKPQGPWGGPPPPPPHPPTP